VSGSQCPGRYEIRVTGVLDDQWAGWFGGLLLSNDGTQTIIAGLLPDRSALHGVLAKIRDLGLCLTLVRRLDPEDAKERSE
jgi:shikimate kinase